MPVVFSEGRYRFLFYSNECSPREPVHVHVLRGGIDAKFWLYPQVKPAYNDGFSARELRELTSLIEQRRSEITRAWNEFFG